MKRKSALATALVAALVATSMMASSATAGSPIDPDGTVHACYKKKGKHKGAVRLSRKCKKREKAATWNEPTDTTSIVNQITNLESTVTTLQAQLDDACDQLTALTGQSNDISDVLDEVLGVNLPVLGITLDSLVTGTLPADLPAYSCP